MLVFYSFDSSLKSLTKVLTYHKEPLLQNPLHPTHEEERGKPVGDN